MIRPASRAAAWTSASTQPASATSTPSARSRSRIARHPLEGQDDRQRALAEDLPADQPGAARVGHDADPRLGADRDRRRHRLGRCGPEHRRGPAVEAPARLLEIARLGGRDRARAQRSREPLSTAASAGTGPRRFERPPASPPCPPLLAGNLRRASAPGKGRRTVRGNRRFRRNLAEPPRRGCGGQRPRAKGGRCRCQFSRPRRSRFGIMYGRAPRSPGVAGDGVEEGHRVSGCTFEVEAAPAEPAPAEADRPGS